MRAVSMMSTGVRHAASVGLQALLIAAIIGTIALALSAVNQPAGSIAGLGSADAGRERAWLELGGGNARAAASGEFTVVGGNFDPDMPVNIVLSDPYCCRFFPVAPGSDGSLQFHTVAGASGSYTVDAYQRLNGKKLTLMASLKFEVTN